MAEFVVKFEPTTLNVNSGPPCVLLLGDIAVTEGVGPGLTRGADAPPPHAVSTLKDPRTATCKNNFIEPLRKRQPSLSAAEKHSVAYHSNAPSTMIEEGE
jgi:hypothetical protein